MLPIALRFLSAALSVFMIHLSNLFGRLLAEKSGGLYAENDDKQGKRKCIGEGGHAHARYLYRADEVLAYSDDERADNSAGNGAYTTEQQRI